jgi:hypothetical protein
LSEFVEVVIELSLLNIHDVILHLHEFSSRLVELLKDSVDTGSKSFTFGVTDFNLVDAFELDDGLDEMDNVLASL